MLLSVWSVLFTGIDSGHIHFDICIDLLAFQSVIKLY